MPWDVQPTPFAPTPPASSNGSSSQLTNLRQEVRHPVDSADLCGHCNRVFSTSQYLVLHQRTCQGLKRDVSTLLQETNDFWKSKKRRKFELTKTPATREVPGNPVGVHFLAFGASLRGAIAHAAPVPVKELVKEPDQMDIDTPGPSSLPVTSTQPEPVSVTEQESMDPDVPVANRRARTQRPLSSCVGSEGALPEPLPTARGDTLPEPPQAVQEGEIDRSRLDRQASPNLQPLVQSRVLVVRSSKPNSFNVSKSYRVPPGMGRIHDPDRALSLVDLTDTTPKAPSAKGHADKGNTDEAQADEGQVNRGQTDKGNTDEAQADEGQVNRGQTDKGRADNGQSGKGLADKRDWKNKEGRGEEERPYGPFTTKSAFELAEWYWGSTQKSFSDFEKLIRIFKNPDFSIPSAIGVDWKATFRALGANRDDIPDKEGGWIQDDGWKTTPISIDVPFHKQTRDPGVQTYFVGNFRHRNILSVIKEKIANPVESRQFHYHPYQATWAPDSLSPALELYGELYSSRAFREIDQAIQQLPPTKQNAGLERVVVALMFWSDATKLTNFGSSTLWPCYMFFGNESKYRRCKPSELLGRQIAYFIKLSDTFKDYLKHRNGGKIPTDALFSHCARELFQSQWCVLLDDELVDAMKNGIVLMCPDGNMRCFYPRIFTYSADYPERVLIAGIRNNGGCPCHRCTVSKNNLANLGAPNDTERRDQLRSEQEQRSKVDEARKVITAGYAVNTDQIEANLKPLSLVPTVNSISDRLSSVNFQLLPALVVDLLHEFEIGVWKNLFIHLIRLLDAYTDRNSITLTAELDTRYRATPPFGRDTIRKFGANASEMKRKAARDYEDLLQCAIPAFEFLLPEPHNTHVMKLLYICAQWHALAKLRLHHDLILDLLDYTTVRLGAYMRLFNRETCERTVTRELQKEADARARRDGKGKVNGTASRKPAKLGVFTIKFHVLGDYSNTIRRYGTTDSYSSETGELCHRLPKAWFERTDKRNYQVQLSEIERRQARLAAIRANLTDVPCKPPISTTLWETTSDDLDPPSEEATTGPEPEATKEAPERPPSDDTTSEAKNEDPDPTPDLPYSIGTTQKSPIDLTCFSNDSNVTYVDPYIKDAIPKLKCHLLPRILRRLGYTSTEASKCDWKDVVLQESRIFSHKLMRINYTTYDVRREQDVIHVDTPQSNVMLLHISSGSAKNPVEHPYIYARVIGIFHANVSYVGQLPDGTYSYAAHRIDFCWVHWYQFHKANDEFALERVTPYALESPRALSFVRPADILRSVHLIPQFSLKRMDKGVPAKSKWDSKSELWNVYFINRFADRDLFMRYQYRMSIGHTYMQNEKFPPRRPIPSIPPDFDHCLDGSGTQGISEDLEHGSDGEGEERPSYDDELDDEEAYLHSTYV